MVIGYYTLKKDIKLPSDYDGKLTATKGIYSIRTDIKNKKFLTTRIEGSTVRLYITDHMLNKYFEKGENKMTINSYITKEGERKILLWRRLKWLHELFVNEIQDGEDTLLKYPLKEINLRRIIENVKMTDENEHLKDEIINQLADIIRNTDFRSDKLIYTSDY